MALLPVPNLDYTDKDFDAILVRLRALVQSVFPRWTDFNAANFGNLILELDAFILDVLLNYQDLQAKESRIVSATQRKNLIALAKLIGYEPASATAASVNLQLSIPVAVGDDVTIPAGVVLQTLEANPRRFQLLTNATIFAGDTQTPVPPIPGFAVAQNSDAQEDDFSTNGTPNQEFTLGQIPYLDGSAIPTASGDGLYTEVQNFLDSEPTSQHFTVIVDQNDRATITFGNGVNGKIPVGDLNVEYKTGGGLAGNVEAGTILAFEGSSTFLVGAGPATVEVSATNAEAAGGGSDRQSLEQIRIQAPESIRVLNRSVAREDFEIVARDTEGVARALMTTKNEDPGVPENTGFLYIIATGGVVPSQATKDAVAARFAETGDFPSTLTFTLEVFDPVFLVVNVKAVTYFRQGQNAQAGADAARAALVNFFKVSNDDGTPNENVDFGINIRDSEGNPVPELALSDVFNLVRDVPGVRKIGDGLGDFTLNDDHRDVPLLNREFPKLGDVTIIDGDTSTTYFYPAT